MSRRIRVMITREGWSYIGMLAFIIAGAIIRDINLLYIMAGMMLGPLLFSFYLSTKSLRRLRLRRRYQRLIGVGDPLFVEVFAEKPKGAPAGYAVAVRDRIRRSAKRGKVRARGALFFPFVRSAGSAEASYRATLRRRGRYKFGPMRVTSSVPLGLIRASMTVSGTDEVLVSPQLGRLLPAWTRRADLKKEGGQRSMRRHGKADGDFFGMREYRNGDSRNWIHWRTTAKRNKLTVREFEQKINHDLVVVLDLWQPKVFRGPMREVEDAISFAATLVVEHGKHGSTHMLVASASESEFVLKGTSSPVFRQELMERLAMVEACTEDKLPEVLSRVLVQMQSNSRVILVTTRDIDFNDTDYFATIWRRTDIRRHMSDVVRVNTTQPEFSEWFRGAGSYADETSSMKKVVA